MTKTLKEIHNYWKDPGVGRNSPHTYAIGNARTDFLCQLVNEYTNRPEDSILELGCNVGRNLHGLWKVGFTHLAGVEINRETLKVSTEIYPAKFHSKCQFYFGSIEEVLPSLGKFHLIFTMAVLEHIHPDSAWIFPEIVKHTRRLITIEDEKFQSWRHFTRNYREVFENLGAVQEYEQNCSGIPGLTADFQARVFNFA